MIIILHDLSVFYYRITKLESKSVFWDWIDFLNKVFDFDYHITGFIVLPFETSLIEGFTFSLLWYILSSGIALRLI